MIDPIMHTYLEGFVRVKILIEVLAWALSAVALVVWGLLLTPKLMIDLNGGRVYVSSACVSEHAAASLLPMGAQGDQPVAPRCATYYAEAD